MKEINQILSESPALISERAELENEQYALWITTHEEFKRVRAKKYFERKVRSKEKLTVADINYYLDNDEELQEIKTKEMKAEITYRSNRCLKDRAKDYFNSAIERGRNIRSEQYSLGDIITTKKERE